jgi:UDP-N-acetylglucosamine diphosphorylase/glucosamine-1-phosphate N-acetyltransferase
MNFILFDDNRRNSLRPLTFMRPIADIRIGILTIRQKWEHYLGTTTSTLTEKYLIPKFPIIKKPDNILINGAVCPTSDLLTAIMALKPNQALVRKDNVIAMRLTEEALQTGSEFYSKSVEEVETEIDFIEIVNSWDIFTLNEKAISHDYQLLTKGRKSQLLSSTNHLVGDNIFIEEGARIEFAMLNTTTGPIYIGRDAEVMEGAMLRGPLALCEHSTVKMGAKIYGATTIGPHSKVGGEVVNSVIFGYSNKAHDGFLGNSVLAEWCNIGADSNTSNLKNTYDNIRIWNYAEQTFVDTGLQFCGLIMGDHSKCGINTMFNTGSVVGISSNIFGPGFQRNFIPSFQWGGTSGFATFDLKRAIKVATAVNLRRNLEFSEIDKEIFETVFDLTYNFRQL